ncbi:hypothetical protein CROQUDRAFT_667034 [Cronartium quercuum f. sp. fusiforme G11]|uniref:Uncharacterized protein n=1 Tax=Cronartium quercuum f. sp. fusiforme G11 TaxID=708437 RepID=A0A9P6N4U0_9BASI|nr:hypothetical protein CROQUDRAFT_667034 [Cronartium quercuum f. sp. fusiforme G11]
MPGSSVTPPDCPIPDMNLITYNVLSESMKKDHGEDLTQREVLASTNHFTQARYVFIRVMVTNWAYNRGEYPGKSQWEVIDAKLHDLHGRRFPGNLTFHQMPHETFPLPTQAQVLEAVMELDAHFPGTQTSDEILYS